MTALDLPKDLIQLRQWFGHSNELLRTLPSDYKCNIVDNGLQSNGLLQQEAHLLASCNYEKGTKWGKQASPLITNPPSEGTKWGKQAGPLITKPRICHAPIIRVALVIAYPTHKTGPNNLTRSFWIWVDISNLITKHRFGPYIYYLT